MAAAESILASAKMQTQVAPLRQLLAVLNLVEPLIEGKVAPLQQSLLPVQPQREGLGMAAAESILAAAKMQTQVVPLRQLLAVSILVEPLI